MHYGLVPRANRGIFVINELPDLAERIQVSLLNVLEERDVQVRGYNLRLPLDLLLVATANPEDYTNRGRIITPLKDRFGAEIRTHYPIDLADEIALVRQEAVLGSEDGDCPRARPPLEIVARFTRHVRESPAVDSALRGVRAVRDRGGRDGRRLGLSARGGHRRGTAVARISDLPRVVATLRGKVEFEAGEEGRELEVLAHLLRRATDEAFRAQLGGADLTALVERFDRGRSSPPATWCPAAPARAGRPAGGPGRADEPARHGRARRPPGRPPRPRSSRSRGST